MQLLSLSFYKVGCIFILLYIAGCVNSRQEKNDQPFETISIDLNQSTPISFERFWNNVQAIQLEVIPQSAMDQIDKAIITSKYLIFYHLIGSTNVKNIMIFDHEGKFYKKIDPYQPGPGNFSYMQDFIAHNDTTIEIIDNIRNKIFIYNLDGLYKKNINLGVSATQLSLFSNGTYALYRGNVVDFDSLQINNNLLLLNPYEKKMQSYVPIKNVFADRAFRTGAFFFPSNENDKFLFCDIANDTIYECSSTSVLPEYLLRFSNEAVTQREIKRLEKEKKKKGLDFNLTLLDWVNNPEVILKPEVIISRKKELLILFRYRKAHHLLLYNRVRKTSQLFHLEEIRSWPVWYAGKKEILMVVGAPLIQKEQFEEKGFPESEQVRSIFEQVDENSNPVILRVDLEKLLSIN